MGEKNFGDLEIQMARFWSVAMVVYGEQIKHGETVFCGGLLPKAEGIATGPQKGTWERTAKLPVVAVSAYRFGHLRSVWSVS